MLDFITQLIAEWRVNLRVKEPFVGKPKAFPRRTIEDLTAWLEKDSEAILKAVYNSHFLFSGGEPKPVKLSSPTKCPDGVYGSAYIQGRERGYLLRPEPSSRHYITEGDDDMDFTEYPIFIDHRLVAQIEIKQGIRLHCFPIIDQWKEVNLLDVQSILGHPRKDIVLLALCAVYTLYTVQREKAGYTEADAQDSRKTHQAALENFARNA